MSSATQSRPTPFGSPTDDETVRRAELLAGALRSAPDTPADLGRLLAPYYRHVPVEDLLGREPAAVLGAAASHLQLARERLPHKARLRVHTPTADTAGWSVGRTVVEVVVDDMPFLVDSLTAELTRQGSAIRLVVHPLVPVLRDGDGSLRQAPYEGGGIESWIHIEVDRLPGADQLERLSAGLRQVLDDVRAVAEDSESMAACARRLAAELDRPAAASPQATETADLLRWLAAERVTLLGHARVDRDGQSTEGLGLLRGGAGAGPARSGQLLTISRSPSRSTVARSAYLDCVQVLVDGVEHRFVGLLSVAAATQSVLTVPVLREKTREILAGSGFPADSASGQDLLQILETYPVDELFQADVRDLERVAHAVLHLQERRRLRLFLRRDEAGRFMSCLVYLPRDLYTRKVRLRMQEVLRDAFEAAEVDYSARVTESVLARLLFVARVAPGRTVLDVDPAALERQLAEVARSWTDDLAGALVALVGEDAAGRLQAAFPEGFPEAYQEDFAPEVGAGDLRRVDELVPPAGLTMSLYRLPGAARTELRLKVFSRAPLSLSAALPVLQHMAVEVMDSRPYEVPAATGEVAYIYDIGLRAVGQLYDASDGLDALFQDAFTAVWTEAAEDDGYNALVLRGGLGWRQVVVLRAYGTYLRQSGWTFSQDYVEQCLVSQVEIARLLVSLFETRFEPDPTLSREARAALSDAVQAELEKAVEAVSSRDHDRILRTFLAAVLATTRTNAFQRGERGRPKPYLSIKLDPSRLPDLPKPRPEREIWVYSPRVEGVHLRFGAVARGGLRWSDRREDFRTEVLGLVKAQSVKNAVIVPVGAKGGFVAKRLPDPADREAYLAEGVASYRTFICGLLDLTDNRDGTEVVPPPRVVRWDGDDPYLVVAADKGTATLSDLANQISAEYGFWLGDAFASGGSAGYDHKAMGITARGAWESVRRHFRELGVDCQSDEFTVVGIGDMSGDVFGNGMLLSQHLRLVAAFDHRHIFLDPDPDAAASFTERRRLFALPRSSWADYDPALLSPGGGIFPRTAKHVPISEPVRKRLGLDPSTTTLSPPELISALLRAPVDLLWNGAIGTYVRAAAESAADVGDKANDAVRVTGAELRCRVLGEGGNLGCTQLGRIEAARSGVRLNTDAIDNSAGVDCSDHEVNIKILLTGADLAPQERDTLLKDMTDDVARAVLRDNYEQNVLLGNARSHARAMLSVHRRYMRDLERAGDLDRALEFLPSSRELDTRASAGQGLTSPELSVLAAYAKNTLKRELLGTGLADEPWCRDRLRDYFPPRLRDRDVLLDRHPLRPEIIVTSVVNDMVNRGGITFAFRAADETTATSRDVVQAFTVVRAVFGLDAYDDEVEELDGRVGADVQDALHLAARRLLDRAVRWLLQARRSRIDVPAELARFAAPVAELLPAVPELVQSAERGVIQELARDGERQGVPAGLALRSAAMLNAFPLLHVVELATEHGQPAADVAQLHYALSAVFDADTLLGRIARLPRGDRWQALARSALRDDLYAALNSVTADVLATTAGADSAARIEQWKLANDQSLGQAQTRLEEIAAGDTFDLATLSVAVRTFRTLLRS